MRITRQYRKGFTLIEMLVVMVIIIILAAILLPVFVTVRNKSRCTRCVSNLKQLSFAAIMYADDNNGNLPEWRPGGWVFTPSFKSFRDTYVESKGVFCCPSDTGYGRNRSSFVANGTSYVNNWAMARRLNRILNLRRCKKPAELGVWHCVVLHMKKGKASYWTGLPGTPYYGRMNIGFGDGHAETLRWEEAEKAWFNDDVW